MNYKTLGIIAIIFGSLVLYSEQEYAWIISAIFIGIGTGVWFWKDKKSDTEAYNKITATEYAYWLILAEWDYFDVAGKVESGYGTGNSEFNVGTSAEIQTKNPLGHTLYIDTVAKILSVPDKDVIRSLF